MPHAYTHTPDFAVHHAPVFYPCEHLRSPWLHVWQELAACDLVAAGISRRGLTIYAMGL